jgi:phage head maturation protease
MSTGHRRDAVSAKAEKTGERTRRFRISDETVDRYNTTLSADGWDTRNFDANPVVLWCHDSSKLPLGKAKQVREGRELFADFEFFADDLNPDASRVMRMVDAGILAASVRFEPLEEEYNVTREKGDWRDWAYPPIDYKRQELLEVSVVTVPGNANALPMRELADMADLRLVAEAALIRSHEGQMPTEPSPRLAALRAAAISKRAAETPAPPVEPAKTEEPAAEGSVDDEEELELVEGMTMAELVDLVKETVQEAIDARGLPEALRRRGEITVTEGA